MGVKMPHAAASSSLRTNWLWSPRNTSRMRRAYASGGGRVGKRALYDSASSVSTGVNSMPGILHMTFRYTASLGWMRITSSLLCTRPGSPCVPPNRPLELEVNCTRTSALRSFSALPHLRMNGTPLHRELLTCSTAVANVGVVLSFGTPVSSVYPGCVPAGLHVYCPCV